MRRAIAAAVALLAVAPLAGCATTVHLASAPGATSTACAGIVAGVVRAGAISGQALRETDSQGTAAWGSGPAITMRCGVVAGISADVCQRLNGVDWQLHATQGHYVVATSYGRSPALGVVVDTDLMSPIDALPTISRVLAARTTATAHCVAGTTGGSGSTPTPAPSTAPSTDRGATPSTSPTTLPSTTPAPQETHGPGPAE